MTLRALFLSCAFWVAGCGMVGEKELDAPKTGVEAPLDSCQFPELTSLIDADKVTDPLLEQAIGCAEKQVKAAFEKIQGSKKDVISLAELRLLHQRKWVDLPLDSESDWALLAIGLELLNPDGEASLSKETSDLLFAWMRSQKTRLLDLMIRSSRHEALTMDDWDHFSEAADSLVEVLSSKFSLSFERAWSAVEAADLSLQSHTRTGLGVWATASGKESLEALWILKSVVIGDNRAGVRGALRGDALKHFIRLGIQLAKGARETARWMDRNGDPASIPEKLDFEWKGLSLSLRNYFEGHHFASIDADLLAWSLRKIEGRQSLADFAPDLVRVTQRLAPEPQRQGGLHPSGFLPIFDTAQALAVQLKSASRAFGNSSQSPYITYREALKDDVLSTVALKGPLDYFLYSERKTSDRPLDSQLTWSTTVGRLAKRAIVSKLFEAFDQQPSDGKIPFNGQQAEDLREPIDLAYSFLRFIAAGAASAEQDDEKKEIQIPNPVLVRPGSLSKVMGLIGDKWMPDGNQDGALSADEFFSVVQVYEDIQDRANRASWNIQSPYYVDAKLYRPNNWSMNFQNQVMKRGDMVRGLRLAFKESSGVMIQSLEQMGDTRRESLFHALFPIDYQARPFEALLAMDFEHKPETLSYVLKRADIIAPAAIVTVLDRLLLRCDTNENGVFEWKELECATPLLLEAGYQTVSSSLIELDPGIHDSSKFLLSFLQAKGLPSLLAKLAMANGSLKEFLLESEFKKIQELSGEKIEASWENIARFIGAPESGTQMKYWLAEVTKRYGKCDANKDKKIGGSAEWSCFEKGVLEQLESTAAQIATQAGASGSMGEFEELRNSPVLRLAIQLGTQSKAEVDRLLTEAKVAASPTKILLLLEEMIRRSVPLWELPE